MVAEHDVSVYGQGWDHASKLIMYRRDAWLPSTDAPIGQVDTFRTDI